MRGRKYSQISTVWAVKIKFYLLYVNYTIFYLVVCTYLLFFREKLPKQRRFLLNSKWEITSSNRPLFSSHLSEDTRVGNFELFPWNHNYFVHQIHVIYSVNNFTKTSVEQCKNDEFILTENIFRQIKDLVIYLVKT